MKTPRLNRRTPVGANMTPMIDVVFLLIIFFLVSSHLARRENRMPLELPAAATAGPLDPERSALTIHVDPQGRWHTRGEVVDRAALEQIVADHVRREGRRAGIRIRTDRRVPYARVQPLLGQAAGAGISDVTLSVRQEGSP